MDENIKDYIQQMLNTMKIGEHLCIECRRFQEAYPCGWPSIYRTHEQAFLSSQIGSAWGCWRVRVDPETGNRIVSRHEESNKRYYVDPDREHLFRRMPDGTLLRKEKQQGNREEVFDVTKKNRH